MPERFAVLGSGAWGTAVALHLAGLNHEVTLYCARPATAAALALKRERTELLPSVAIPESIRITADAATMQGADHWIVAVPTAHLREVMARFRTLAPRQGVVSLTKGLEIGSFCRPTEIIAEAIPGVPLAALSGPSHAEEVARGLPTSLVVASKDAAYAERLQALMGSERIRLYASPDILGAELAGALKNVMAIAAGASDGLGLGDNAKAALLTRGLVEMTRFGVGLGADAATFSGLAGLGDLIATCCSPHGRNRRAGERVAQGEAVASVIGGPKVIEGYYTAKSVSERAKVDLPIMTGVYELLYESKPAARVLKELMARPQRSEGTA